MICSFCRKSRYEVRRLIRGPSALICNECVDRCNRTLGVENATAARRKTHSINNADAERCKKPLGINDADAERCKKPLGINDADAERCKKALGINNANAVRFNAVLDVDNARAARRKKTIGVGDANAEQPVSAGRPQLTPQQLFKALDVRIVAQTRAKRTLSVAIYNHYKRVGYRPGEHDVELTKGNALLLGPTGSGKTLMAQSLAQALDVPLAIIDATTLTASGYIGKDVDSIAAALYRAAGGDLERAEQGIVFLDEADKLASRGVGPTSGRDVSGEGVQNALLKLLEGRKAKVRRVGPPGANGETVTLDTRNVLFICSGAFTGLENVVRERLARRRSGFSAANDQPDLDDNALRAHVKPADLISYGFTPEFVSRLPVRIACDSLTCEDLVEVLWRPKGALIKQYEYLLALEGARLTFTSEAMLAIARRCVDSKSGARGLRTAVENVMTDVMYEIPSRDDVSHCVIDEDAVLGLTPAKLKKGRQAS